MTKYVQNKKGGGLVINKKRKTFYSHKNVCLPDLPPKGCRDIYPRKITPKILKGETLQYVTFSNGVKRIYRDKDGSTEYGNVGILDPSSVSYVNLFINGILQPPILYQVNKGILTLTSQDVPNPGVPIILQFILIYEP